MTISPFVCPHWTPTVELRTTHFQQTVEQIVDQISSCRADTNPDLAPVIRVRGAQAVLENIRQDSFVGWFGEEFRM